MTSQLVIFPEYPSQMSLFPLHTMSSRLLDETLTARNKPHWSRPIASQISAFKCPGKKEREPSPSSQQQQEEPVPKCRLAARGSRWVWPASACKGQTRAGQSWAGSWASDGEGGRRRGELQSAASASMLFS